MSAGNGNVVWDAEHGWHDGERVTIGTDAAGKLTTRHYLDGRRIEIPAHYDSWMMGDRFGVVVKVTRTHVHVTMDRSGRTKRFLRDDIERYAVTLD